MRLAKAAVLMARCAVEETVAPDVKALLAHDVSDNFHSAKSKVQERGSTLDWLCISGSIFLCRSVSR